MLKKTLPLLIIVGAIALAYGMLRMRQQPEQSDISEAVLLVETRQLVPTSTQITVQSQGTVEARTRTTLVSEVSGTVVEVSPAFVPGGFFRRGDMLLRVDDADYQAALSRSEAALASARSALQLEQGQADVAQREWDRLPPDQQARIVGKDLYLRKPQLAEAEARLVAAEADLEEAKRDLARTRILAPYDGLVSSKSADIGQYINAGSTLAETFAIDYAEVRLPIPETRLAWLDLPGATALATSDMEGGPSVTLSSDIGGSVQQWEGYLSRTEGVLDTRTRVLYAVVRVQDPYGVHDSGREVPLRVGTFVNASIAGSVLENVYVLPRHTLQGNNIVWVADQENRLRSRTVQVVTVNGDEAYVSEGFEPGDRLVLTRMENPLNGMAIQTTTRYNPVN